MPYVTWNSSEFPDEFAWNGAIDGSMPNSAGTVFTTRTTSTTGYVKLFTTQTTPPPDEPHIIQELI